MQVRTQSGHKRWSKIVEQSGQSRVQNESKKSNHKHALRIHLDQIKLLTMIVQRKDEGIAEGSVGNIVIVPISSHMTTDAWHGCGIWRQSKVWERRTSQVANRLTFSSRARDGIFRAYKLGRYQGEYVFLLFNYRSKGCRPTVIDWDGVSHLLYIVSWWVNFPSKYFRKLAYIIYSRRSLLILDHLILLPVSFGRGSCRYDLQRNRNSSRHGH